MPWKIKTSDLDLEKKLRARNYPVIKIGHSHGMSTVQPVLQVQPVCQVATRAGACQRCQGCPLAHAGPTKGPQAYPDHFRTSTIELDDCHLLLVGLFDGPLKPCNLAPGHPQLHFEGRRQRKGRSMGDRGVAGCRVQNVGGRNIGRKAGRKVCR